MPDSPPGLLRRCQGHQRLAAALAFVMTMLRPLACLWPASSACQPLDLERVSIFLGMSAVFVLGLLAVDASRRFLPVDPQRRATGLLVQITVFALGTTLLVLLGAALTQGGPQFSPYALQVQFTLSAAACLVLEFRARSRAQLAGAEALQRSEQDLARQLDAARAALLQAQVEPHFLFNTLAHLRRLATLDPGEARAMLADLLRYLQAALPELRREHTLLAQELELVRAFLALHQRRLGEARLRLRFEIEPGLDAVTLPSTALLTLAENAIKHGITPVVDGGEVCVRARRHGPRLVLEVADTGAGMGTGAGSGTGLATLRARLAAFDPQAALSLTLNQPRGLIARIEL